MIKRSLRKSIWVAALIYFFIASQVFASTTVGTIDPARKYAWSSNLGWINFNFDQSNIVVTDTRVTGYAWSKNYGMIILDPAQGGVLNNGQGVLSGYAWGADIGWINFSGATIDSQGVFHGTAIGGTIGSLIFDCANCAVATDWRPISVRNPVPPGGGGGGGGTTPTSTPTTTPIAFTPIENPTCTYSDTTLNPNITRNGLVDIFDFNSLMVEWSKTGINNADINHDCIVDIFDFNSLMVGWSA